MKFVNRGILKKALINYWGLRVSRGISYRIGIGISRGFGTGTGIGFSRGSGIGTGIGYKSGINYRRIRIN